jgi:hypothetical protein
LLEACREAAIAYYESKVRSQLGRTGAGLRRSLDEALRALDIYDQGDGDRAWEAVNELKYKKPCSVCGEPLDKTAVVWQSADGGGITHRTCMPSGAYFYRWRPPGSVEAEQAAAMR